MDKEAKATAARIADWTEIFARIERRGLLSELQANTQTTDEMIAAFREGREYGLGHARSQAIYNFMDKHGINLPWYPEQHVEPKDASTCQK